MNIKRNLNLPEQASGVPMIILPQWNVLNCWASHQKLLHMLEEPRLEIATNFIQLKTWANKVFKSKSVQHRLVHNMMQKFVTKHSAWHNPQTHCKP